MAPMQSPLWKQPFGQWMTTRKEQDKMVENFEHTIYILKVIMNTTGTKLTSKPKVPEISVVKQMEQ